MLVSPGQLVAAGEPLFAIDDRRYAAVMEEAAAALRAAEAELGTIDRRIALQQAAVERSIDRLRAEADVILPGHDNFFWNDRRGAPRP